MKKVLLVVSVLFVLISCNEKEEYYGKITEKFITGGGRHSESKGHVVFYSNELKRKVHIIVNWDCYVNSNINDDICVSLSKTDLMK